MGRGTSRSQPVLTPAPSPARHTSQEPQPFASNNPFNPSFNSAFPPPPTAGPGIAQEDTDLQRALALSTEDDRTERERSVRASAPPPSPGRLDEPTFGPSNKDDPQGSLAMVRTVSFPMLCCREFPYAVLTAEHGNQRQRGAGLPARAAGEHDDGVGPLDRRRRRWPPAPHRT